MSSSEYDICNRKVLEYIKKERDSTYSPKFTTLEEIVYYLTLNLGYTPARQKYLLKELGYNLKIEAAKNHITDCITAYKLRRHNTLMSFTTKQ